MSEKSSKTGLPSARKIRIALKLETDVVAKKAGKSESHWRRVEAGTTNCPMEAAEAAAEFMCCTILDLRSVSLSKGRLQEIVDAYKIREAKEVLARQDKKAGAA